MFNHKLPQAEFPMQTLRKKTSPCKYKNEPSRFLGEGVAFKAKLIGILEVGEARGDRMCQEALADLKMAIRAAGEHKQRISVHVAIDGLRLRDEKTGDSLYHHPVHKISFIAQDMSDSRAFGYIFGSPDTGHRFFGIKTDKAASQVVIAMRDLFQVVFELKKKEIELAKQQLEGKTITLASRYISTAALDTSKAQQSSDGSVSARSRLSSRREGSAVEGSAGPSGTGVSSTGGAVAELVDLEQELSSLQRGLHQMERLTPPTDPFGDSFTSTPGFLPPPPSSSRGGRASGLASEGGSPFSPAPPPPTSSSSSASRPPHFTFEPPHRSPPRAAALLEPPPPSPPAVMTEPSQIPSEPSSNSNLFDVFTDLDPLGTGRSKPYVDKKHFFQELKNPPKKVLKDLVTTDVPPKPAAAEPKTVPPLPKSMFEVVPKPDYLTSVGRHSGGSVSIGKHQEPPMFPILPSLFTSDPFAETDPFDNTDPFAESLREDPFIGPSGKEHETVQETKPFKAMEPPPFYQESKLRIDIPVSMPPLFSSVQSDMAPLQVSLPPEANKSPRLLRQPSTDSSKSSIRQRPQWGKQQPSPSPPPPLPPKKPVERADRNETGPPLPLPARRRAAPTASLGWEDDYLPPRRPAPSPSPGLDITLAQLLTCGVDELADRLRMPADVLSRMTIVQLTGHLREYLQTGNEIKKEAPTDKPPQVAERPPHTLDKTNIQFEANFEDNFAAGGHSDAFVANFDHFKDNSKPSYDRYAVFREIEVEEFKSLPNDVTAPNPEEPDSLSSQPELPSDPTPAQTVEATKLFSDIKFESLNIANTQTKSATPNSKLEELKSVISSLHKTNVSPTPDIDVTPASDTNGKDSESRNAKSNSDRYAALRDLSTVDETPRPFSADLPDEPELSAPLQVPKERKRSDEKSDGFDHSDFFDCIDNSLSLNTADDAFRKSPLVIKEIPRTPEKLSEPIIKSPAQLTAPQPSVSGSISDIASGSSPEIVLTGGAESGSAGRRSRDAWALLNEGSRGVGPRRSSRGGGSPWSSEESPPHHEPQHHRRTRRNIKMWHTRQTSSSSRDVSPWEEDPLPPRDPVPHTRSYHRERHESAGSRERRDSGGSRERRDSGSGRDRHRRRRLSPRDDDDDWSGEGSYTRRPSSREARRERGWSHDDRRRPDERGYSTVGRREGRRRGEPPWQSEEPVHRYSSTMGSGGWRRSGSSGEGGGERTRPPRHRAPPPRSHRSPSPPPPSSPTSRSRHRHRFFDDFNQSEIDSPIAPKNNGTRFRFSNDFSEKDSPKSQNSPFENDFVENINLTKKTISKYESSYANLEKESPMSARVSNFRFKYDKELSSENLSGSPASPRPRHSSPPLTARSLFEDDFSPEPRNGILRAADINGDHTRKETIHEGEELQVIMKEEKTEKMVGFDFGSGKEGIPENRRSQKLSNKNRPKVELDIKKSESVNIFARESDPFDGDDFFNCTASDRPRRDNWQASFENM